MFGKQRKKQEWVPWYRRKDYKGDLTEAEKRELDAFRMQEKHPANHYQDLPNEVQERIIALEVKANEFELHTIATRCLFVSIAGAIITFLAYKGHGDTGNFGYLIGILLLTVPWIFVIRGWRKNANEYCLDPDEGFRTEWELNYIAEHRKKPLDTEI